MTATMKCVQIALSRDRATNVSSLFWNTPLALANENRLPLLRCLDVFSKRAFFSYAIFFPLNLFFSKRFSMRFSWFLFSILHCGRFFSSFFFLRSFSRVRDSTNIFWKRPNFENRDRRCRCNFGTGPRRTRIIWK